MLSFAFLALIGVVVGETITETAAAAGGFETLGAALVATGLADALSASGDFTVFAPTDAAFEELLSSLGLEAADLLARPDLSNILNFHVVSGRLASADLQNGARIQTLLGGSLLVTIDEDGSVAVGGAAVETADIQASNGIIHAIGRVLLPTSISDAADSAALSLDVLLTALGSAGLQSTLDGPGPFTIMAPSDEAFTSLLGSLDIDAATLLARPDLADILTYHVAGGSVASGQLSSGLFLQTLQGGQLPVSISSAGAVSIGGAAVIAADVHYGSGVIHVIDSVLIPPSRLALAGGADGWDEGSWAVSTDNVMGGRSTGSVEFEDGAMVFSGDVNLNGGGFSNVQRNRMSSPMDLSGYDGFWVETEATPFSSGEAPLVLSLQLLDDSSSYDYAAPLAIPFSSTPGERIRTFVPLTAFDRGSRWGQICSQCSLDATAVNGLQIYVLYQGGPFEARIREISAVLAADAPLQPFAPAVPAVGAVGGVVEIIEATISTGAAIYDNGYKNLCAAMYASTARTIVAAPGATTAAKGLACAGLERAASGDWEEKAWALRMVFDAILADERDGSRVSASRYPSYVQGDWLPQAGAASEAFAEICASPTPLHAAPVVSTSDGMEFAGMDKSGSMDGFAGPCEAMGISGYNDLGSHSVSSPAECVHLCRQNDRCRSVDFGARGQVDGECWLSTANRVSAGSAYKSWTLYDYYERTDSAGSAGCSHSAHGSHSAKGSAVGSDSGGYEANQDGKDDQEEDGGFPILMAILAAAVVVICLLVSLIVVLVMRKRSSSGAAYIVGNESAKVVVGRPVSETKEEPALGVPGVVVNDNCMGA